MLNTLFSHRTQKSLRLYLAMNKIALCEQVNGQSKFLAGEFVQSDLEWAEIIKMLVKEHRLKNDAVSVVISHDFYQKFDIDKPDLEEKELLASLPFLIKDLVSESIFDLVVDYIDKPKQARKKRQMTAVCMPRSRVIQIRDMLSDNELNLTAISIDELTSTQLLTVRDEAQVLLCQQGAALLLSVVKAGQLHFSLRIRGVNALLRQSQSALDNTLLETLSLEIQRTLDFIHSQLQITTIEAFYLALPCADIELMADLLSGYLGREVTPFAKHYRYDFLLAYGSVPRGLSE